MSPAMTPARSRYDAVVIGGGHNGLVAAVMLSKAGKSVLLLEGSDAIGGMAASREFHPGFRTAIPHLLYQLHPAVSRALRLHRHGLRLAAADLPTIAFRQEGGTLALGDSRGAGDAGADLLAFRQRLARFARALAPALARTPPRLRTRDLESLATLGRLALGVRWLGREEMRELLRVIGMNVADLVEENFADPTIKAAIALDAVIGNAMGPRSPNTVYTLLYRLAGKTGHRAGAIALPKGSMAAVAEAMAAAARAAGVEILTGTSAARILVKDGRSAGVVLPDGGEIASDLVLSSADPRRTFLEILGPAALDTNFVRRARSWRDRGTTGKLHLALNGLPAALAGAPARYLLPGTLATLERAFDSLKYGDLPERPPIEIAIPSLADPSAAPAGKHLLSAIVQYVPYRLAEGDWSNRRTGFVETLLGTLEAHIPGLRAQILAQEFLTPADIERMTGASGGHWHHGEIALDQVWMLRPQPGMARYATPVPGLYLCGAGAHPGGGITGLAGYNAARQAIADGRTKERSRP
ncbi:MAG: phytoene desaturase family protein [Dongiaceae bacterium]